MNFLKQWFSFILLVILLSFLFIDNKIYGEKISKEIEIQFIKPLRVNEINFYKIFFTDQNISYDELILKLYNPSFDKAVYSFNVDRRNSIIYKNKNGITIEGYFFLPNLFPIGKGIIEIQLKNSIVCQKEIAFNPEVIFHSPMFQKGFPMYAQQSEMGMQHSTAEAFPVSQICFSNTKKKSFFFLNIKLKNTTVIREHTKLKLRIYVKQRILDEIIVDSSPKDYIYCLSKEFIGSIDWLKIRFETFTMEGKPLILKETIYDFEYLSLLPFNGLPRWINSFLKKTDFIEEKFRCRQE